MATGWDVNQAGGANFDLDLNAAALTTAGKVPVMKDPTDKKYQEWFIYANHHYPSGRSIVFAVVIWRAEKRGQVFGAVRNAFIRVFDEVTGEELARYDLGAEFSDETLVVFGELYRRGDEWKFRALGQGYAAADYRNEHGIKRSFETEYAR